MIHFLVQYTSIHVFFVVKVENDDRCGFVSSRWVGWAQIISSLILSALTLHIHSRYGQILSCKHIPSYMFAVKQSLYVSS